MADFEVYSVGPCYASVCTNLSDEVATLRLNLNHPTGISSQWRMSKEKSFQGGLTNPSPCPDHAGNRHILFSC